MSFGHSMSRKPRSTVVHYRIGEINKAPKHWYSKRIGWFGNTVLATCLVVFGLFSVQVRDMMLQVAGGQLSNLSSATGPQEEQLDQLPGGALKSAKNIIEVQPLLSEWARTNNQVQWGMVVKSITGPQIDATVQHNAVFDSRATYKVYLAAALYDQIPQNKLYTTVKVNNKKVALNTCLERMFKDDDRECTAALSSQLDLAKAMAFLKGPAQH